MLKKLFVFLTVVSLFFSTDTLWSTEDYASRGESPYDNLELLPFDGHGWFGHAEPLKKCLSELSYKSDDFVVIEVGVWLGKSARFLAESIDPNGKVYCIDNWTGPTEPTSAEIAGYQEESERLGRLYQQFLSNVVHGNLTHKMIPIRMNSLDAAKNLDVMADLIYIDAGHAEDVVFKDVLAWIEHLKPNGIICGDDWYWDSVRAGVEKAAHVLDMRIESGSNFWRLYRKID